MIKLVKGELLLATRFKIWEWGGPVGAGVMQSVRLGVAGVAKCGNASHPFTVASELVCANLARSLLLPVPPSFVVENDEQKPFHVSLNFALGGENLPPADAQSIVDHLPHAACGTLVFDTWIANPDRHNANLAFDEDKVQLMLFDHGHAFLGSADPTIWLRSNRVGFNIGSHCLRTLIEDISPMQDWINRILAIPSFYIRGIIDECVSLGIPSHLVQDCVDFLEYRRMNLKAILKSNANQFPKVPAPAWTAF